MAENYLTIISDMPINYTIVIDGSIEKVQTGFPPIMSETVNDVITPEPDGTTRLTGETGPGPTSTGWYGDSYTFDGTFVDVSVSVDSSANWTFLLNGKQVKESGLLSFTQGEEPEPSTGGFAETHPIWTGVIVGAITRAVLP